MKIQYLETYNVQFKYTENDYVFSPTVSRLILYSLPVLARILINQPWRVRQFFDAFHDR